MTLDFISTGILVLFAIIFFGREISFARTHDRTDIKQVITEDPVSRRSGLDAYLRLSRDVDLPKIEQCVREWEKEKARKSTEDFGKGSSSLDGNSTKC